MKSLREDNANILAEIQQLKSLREPALPICLLCSKSSLSVLVYRLSVL
jgi:hypothetical protein